MQSVIPDNIGILSWSTWPCLGGAIAGYDEMNVEEVSGRLNDLPVEELQLLRDYEERNKRRDTLLEQMDRKIRAT